MKINITYDVEDWKIYQKHIEKTFQRNKPKDWYDSYWFNLISWFALAFTFLYVFQLKQNFEWHTAAIVSIFFIYLGVQVLLAMNKMKRFYEPLPDGSFCGKHTFTFDEDGIQIESSNYQGRQDWLAVKKVEESDSGIFIYIDSVFAYVFPQLKIPS